MRYGSDYKRQLKDEKARAAGMEQTIARLKQQLEICQSGNLSLTKQRDIARRRLVQVDRQRTAALVALQNPFLLPGDDGYASGLETFQVK
jgi:hypothetical protein